MTIDPGDPSLPDGADGSIANPRRWYVIRAIAGTNAADFSDHMEDVCNDLEENPTANGNDDDSVFMWDNLRSHHAQVVWQTVEGRPSANRFRSTPRPPYQPKYSLIEYVFCEICARLEQIINRDDTNVEFRVKIEQTCNTVGRNGGIDRTFQYSE
jgi:hypothetical protein